MPRYRNLVTAAVLIVLLSPPLGAAARAVDKGWVWPLQPVPEVVARFDPPVERWNRGHRGVDLLGSTGQRVLAIGAGEVSFAGEVAGRGVVVVDHGNLRSTYEPVMAAMSAGDSVAAGQVLGLLQGVHSHCAPLVCLHLGVKRSDAYLDPLSLLGSPPVRLKPLGQEPQQQMRPPGLSIPTPGSPGVAAIADSTDVDAPTSTTVSTSVGLGAAAGAAALLLQRRSRRVRPPAR